MPRGFSIPKKKPAGWKPKKPKGTSVKPKPKATSPPGRKGRPKQRTGPKVPRFQPLEHRTAYTKQQQIKEKKLRREQWTVKNTDTAETIAKALGATPQSIAEQSPEAGLKAGQVLEYNVPDVKYTGASQVQTPDVTAEQVRTPDSGLGDRAQGMLDFQKQLQGEMQVSRMGTEPGNLMEGQLEPGETLTPSFTGQPGQVARTPDAYKASERATQDTNYWSPERRAYAVEISGARATGQWLQYVYNSKDFSSRPDYITEFMMMQYGPEMQRAILEDLGYVYVPGAGEGGKGLFIAKDLPESVTGGGAGGEGRVGANGQLPPDTAYPGMPVYPAADEPYYSKRGATGARGGKGGHKARVQGGRLGAGSLPAAHWRI